jgi:SAM-dependent methyltransferase
VDERTRRIFFEIHSGLAREAPGDAESTGKALELIAELPSEPRILDVGCGPGTQTMDLVRLTGGTVVAVDNHQPFLDDLMEKAARENIGDRVRAINADMAALDFDDDSFDLIWAECSAYIMGIENALEAWKRLLHRPGHLALTEVAWLRDDPPEELQSFWDAEYPQIRDAEACRAAIRRAGYRVLGHFALPESAWWNHYYTPLERKLGPMREKYGDEPEALAVIDMHQREIDLYREYSDYYGYVFYVMQLKA